MYVAIIPENSIHITENSVQRPNSRNNRGSIFLPRFPAAETKGNPNDLNDLIQSNTNKTIETSVFLQRRLRPLAPGHRAVHSHRLTDIEVNQIITRFNNPRIKGFYQTRAIRKTQRWKTISSLERARFIFRH